MSNISDTFTELDRLRIEVEQVIEPSDFRVAEMTRSFGLLFDFYSHCHSWLRGMMP
jgi:hypothetical protein